MTLPRRFARLALGTAIAALTLLIHAAPGGAAPAATSPFKRLQAYRLSQEPMRERAEKSELREMSRKRLRELRRLARAMRRDGRTSLQARGESARPQGEDEDVRAGRPPFAGATARTARPSSLGATLGPPRANARCNNPAGDVLGDGQCETSIVRWNDYMLAAWNDGTGFSDLSNQTQGWATSVDGGVTWVDRGKFPLASGTWVWSSDPVLAVNPVTGAFYYSALADADPTHNAIGLIKGRFTGGSFAWGPVSVVRSAANSSNFLDKQWIALDPVTGKVCLSYTDFVGNLSQIEFQSADSALTTWTAPLQVSPSAENGWVQGSRPIVAPGGTIHVVYYLIGPVDVDYYRICRSTNGGASFSPPVDAVSAFTNYGTGAPGFNRAQAIQFPSIAVDRSGGAHDGRLYLSWSESLNWYNDTGNLGAAGPKNEIEPNDTFSQATPLSVGQVATGAVDAGSDIFDYYSVSLAAGQSLIASVNTVGSNVLITMRMIAADGSTRLAYTTAQSADLAYGHPTWMYTAPRAGTYYLRVAASVGAGSYSVDTGPAFHGSERGRDQRDVFVNYSDDGGTSWSVPARVSASPAGYDDWLPEVAVGPDGEAYAAWYDWRDAAPLSDGGESNVYLAHSGNGGVTWTELGATSDATTQWTAVDSRNIVPNQGDYISLFAEATGVSVAWADGRSLDPDVYMSFWTRSEVGAAPAPVTGTLQLAGARPNPVTGSSVIDFTLVGSGPATLDLLDLNGRRVRSWAVSAGSSSVPLTDGTRLRPGMYFVRLTQYGVSRSKRIVVL